jgi:hypothetical protein
MSRLVAEIRANELTKVKKISQTEYRRAEKTLSSQEFKARYKEDAFDYFEIIEENANNEELDLYINYQKLIEIRKLEKYTKTIKNIMIFWVVISIIGTLIALMVI